MRRLERFCACGRLAVKISRNDSVCQRCLDIESKLYKTLRVFPESPQGMRRRKSTPKDGLECYYTDFRRAFDKWCERHQITYTYTGRL